MKKIIYSLVLCLSIASVNAQMLLNDNFNYGSSADTLTNPSVGGTIWKRHSATAGPIPYLNSSLSYAGYPSSGVGGSAQLYNATSSREDVNAPVNPITTGNVYVSFLMKVTASGGTTGDYFFHLNDSQGTAISTAFKAKLWIKDGSSASTFQLGLTKGAAVTSAVFSSNYNLNTTYLVVMKYVFNSSTADDSVYAWVFSSGIPTLEPAAQLTATDITQTDLPLFRSVCMRQGSVGTDTCIVDGIRVSTIWANAPLPVKYNSIAASKLANSVVINWSTASETNNHHFEIEKSTDNKNFVTIGEIKGNGNSSSMLKYNFIDNELSKGTSYYRLKQVDYDGIFDYSKTVSVVNNSTTKNTSTTLPNPFNNELNIHVTADVTTTAQLEVIDMLGKVHYSGIENLIVGDNKITINTSNLNDGIYFVRTNMNGEISTQKIIKK